MLSTKIRSIIVSAVALTAVSVPGVATAATPVHKLGAQLHVVVSVKRASAVWKQAGSAGVTGYDNARCESLLNDYNTAVDHAEGSYSEADGAGTETYGEVANRIYGQLTGNCLLID